MISLSPPLPPLADLGVRACDACGGSHILAHTDEALVPAGPWSGEVLPMFRGGTIVKPGQAVECVCREPREVPPEGHPAAMLIFGEVHP